MNLQLNIESSATVPKTAQFKIFPKSTTNNNDDSNASRSQDMKCHVKLNISHGNVFHPYSKVTILLPSNGYYGSGVNDEEESSRELNYNIKIGESNLFGEDCDVTIVLDPIDPDIVKDDDQQHQRPKTLIGSYNQFTPKCKICTNKIGNGNIFHPLCNIHITNNLGVMMIGNGNIFNSFVSIHESNIENDLDHDEDDYDKNSIYHNQVFFLLSSQSSASILYNTDDNQSKRAKLMRRTNDNGVRKNMSEITLLLSAMKKIIQSNHPLMSSTT